MQIGSSALFWDWVPVLGLGLYFKSHIIIISYNRGVNILPLRKVSLCFLETSKNFQKFSQNLRIFSWHRLWLYEFSVFILEFFYRTEQPPWTFDSFDWKYLENYKEMSTIINLPNLLQFWGIRNSLLALKLFREVKMVWSSRGDFLMSPSLGIRPELVW